MKWLMRTAMGVAVVCFGLGALLTHHARNESRCFARLTGIDHIINCPGVISWYPDIVSNGVWTTKEAIHEWLAEDDLRCPTTGADYALTLTIGEHPYCPVHGHLIEKYGYRPHQPLGESLRPRRLAGPLLFLLGGLLAAGTGAVALAGRAKRRRHNPGVERTDSD